MTDILRSGKFLNRKLSHTPRCHSLHFEISFDVVAQILTELWLFQNLTKFGDDKLKTATCIAENVTISFKHEYRRQI